MTDRPCPPTPDDPSTWDGALHGDEYDVYVHAVSGVGDRAYDWSDKPHRLVYDLVRECRRLQNWTGVLQASALCPTTGLLNSICSCWRHGPDPK